MKPKILKILLIILCGFLLIFGILKLHSLSRIEDFYPQDQVSSTLNESKEKKVFIAEYKICNIRMYDSSIKFSIEQMWLEKTWDIALDKNRKIIYEINKVSPPQLVFTLYHDTLFNEDNFLKKWEISNNDSALLFIGVTNRKINAEFRTNPADTLSFTIYKQHAYGDLKTKVADFKIKRVVSW
jgi:hypothetical protein